MRRIDGVALAKTNFVTGFKFVKLPTNEGVIVRVCICGDKRASPVNLESKGFEINLRRVCVVWCVIYKVKSEVFGVVCEMLLMKGVAQGVSVGLRRVREIIKRKWGKKKCQKGINKRYAGATNGDKGTFAIGGK